MADPDAAAVASDAESSRVVGPASGPAERATKPTDGGGLPANDVAGGSNVQLFPAQDRQRSETQRVVGFPIVPVKVAVSSPVNVCGGDAASGSFQPAPPTGDGRNQGSMHDILGSEALAAALRDANGSPGRAGMVPRSPPGAHLAHIAAQGHKHTVLFRGSGCIPRP